MEDNKWHHFCVTFSGITGVAVVYVDGERRISETMIPEELEGGGMLRVGEKWLQLYKVSGLNLWDRILSPEEIRDLATSCLKGFGNVKHWFDFSEVAKAATNNVIFQDPSSCAPSTPLPGTGTEPTPEGAMEQPSETTE